MGRTRRTGRSASQRRLLRRAAAPVWLAWGVALGIALPAEAADHLDGPLTLDVQVGLAEGPPYPAAPVEIGVAWRGAGGPPIPAGEMHFVLVNADAPSTGDPIPLAGEATDNGVPFGEPGDTAWLDLYFVPGEPPNDDLPSVSHFLWAHRPEPTPSAPTLEFTSGEPMHLDLELFFQDYEAEVNDTDGTPVGSARMRNRFEITEGQDLYFANVAMTGPDASGEVRYSGELRRTPGGSFDPEVSLYRLTVSNEPVRGLPGLPALTGLVVAGAMLLAAAALALRGRAAS